MAGEAPSGSLFVLFKVYRDQDQRNHVQPPPALSQGGRGDGHQTSKDTATVSWTGLRVHSDQLSAAPL